MGKLILLIKNRKKFIVYSLLRVLTMVLGLITNIFIVRELSMNDFGIFSVATMIVGLITTFGFSWSSSSILYYGSREKAQYGNINKTFWSRNIIIFFSLIITTIIFIVFGREINDYIGFEASFLILVWLYVSVAENYLSQYYLAVKRQLLSTMLSVTAKVIYIILVLVISFDVKTLIVLNIASHATVILYVLGMNKNDIGKFEFDISWFKEVLNFSLWQLFGFSGLYIINFGDTAVIKYFMTIEDIGIYNVAYKLFSAIAEFSYVISSYYASSISQHFTNNDHKEINNFFYKERFFIITISTTAHIIVMVFANPIIVALYGERYMESVKIFNILMVGSMFKYVGVFYMLYYNTNRKYMLQQTINILRAVLNLGLDIIFIKYFGLIGPAIATTAAYIMTFTFSAFYCEERIKIVREAVKQV